MTTVFSVSRVTGLLLGSLLVLSNCTEQHPSQHPVAAAPASVTAPAAAPSAAAALPDTTEYLDWAAARINGRLPLQSSPQAVWQELGRPDSLVTPDWSQECVSFFDRNFRRGYVRGATVEVYGDTAVVTSLDLQRQPTLTLHAGSLRLSHSTTLPELARAFPREVSRQGSHDDDYLGPVVEVTLFPGLAPSDDRWRLLFKNGRLARIDYWMPC